MNEFKLTVLETSDVHGNIFPINYGANKQMELGLAKVASLIKQEKKKNENVLTIDNGDVIQGTPLTYHYARFNNEKKNPMTLLLNELGYDCSVFGNHEFNYGLDILQKAVEESNFPWLSANILRKETGEAYYGKPYLIKEFPNGLRVGILGLTTHYIPNWEKPEHIKGIEFEDAIQSAQKWVPYIREQKQVDVLIVAYHGGFERHLKTGEPTEELTGENQGYRMCHEVEGIDLLLTGHQHRSISTTINGVPVIQPASQGMKLGKAEIAFKKTDDKWLIDQVTTDLLSVENVQADQAILQMVQSYEDETQEWLDQPIGKIEGDMVVQDPMKIRTKDNALIEFFNKIQMDVSGAPISSTALFDNFAPGLTENVTMRDVVANYIYPNTLRVIEVTGQDIKDALERSASYFDNYDGESIKINPSFVDPKPQHYNYDMWEGIEYLINVSKPIGERIVQLDFQGKPLEMDGKYQVVMNNYRASGGGDYLMFQDKPVIKDIPTDVSELIANYILERKIIKATVNNNWKVIHD